MPPLPSIANTIRVKYEWDVGSDLSAVTILHFRYTGGPPVAADALALATDLHGAAVTHLIPLLGTNSSLLACEVTDLSGPSAAQATFASTVTGTRSGTTQGAAVAALTSWGILRRYRGGKPRSYWPFGTGSDLATLQTWNSTFLTAIQGGVQLWLNEALTFASGTVTLAALVSISYYNGFTVVTNPITGRARNVPKLRVAPVSDDIVTFSHGPKLATQRRRNQRRV